MNSKHLEAALAVVKDIFGESTEPETIKKFKAVEDALTRADEEETKLVGKYHDLAKDYKELILGTGTKTPPDNIVPEKPKSLEERLADAFEQARQKATQA